MWGWEGKEMGQMQRWTEMGRREEHSKQLAWGKAEELTYIPLPRVADRGQ